MRTLSLSVLLIAVCLAFSPRALSDDTARTDVPDMITVQVISSLDGTEQPVRYWKPPSDEQRPAAMLLFLHSWSSDYTQDNSKWLKEAVDRNWIFLHPNFRGVNNSPQACGSKFARQDVLDALDFACENFHVDRSRIYLAGTSGGGHMAMLMAGHHPDRFSAVSAWVGISDLRSWYAFHVRDGEPQRYASMIAACLSGPPGTSPEIDADYFDRSPLFHLKNVGDLPIDIHAGVRDGVSGSVPFAHSLNAYNAISNVHGTSIVSAAEIESLVKDGRLDQPQPSDEAADPEYGRAILLRRTSNNARVTIFDGGHESLPDAACVWLAKQRRLVPTDAPNEQKNDDAPEVR